MTPTERLLVEALEDILKGIWREGFRGGIFCIFCDGESKHRSGCAIDKAESALARAREMK